MFFALYNSDPDDEGDDEETHESSSSNAGTDGMAFVTVINNKTENGECM